MYVVIEDLSREASDVEQLICYCGGIEEAREVAEGLREEGKNALILAALILLEGDSSFAGFSRTAGPHCAMQCMGKGPEGRILQ